jgi:uncharacterized protein (TIGR02594 family)
MRNLLLAVALVFGIAAAPVGEAVAKPKKEHVHKKHVKKKKKIMHKISHRRARAPKIEQVAAAPEVCHFMFWEVPCDQQHESAVPTAAEQRKRIADGSKIISNGQKYVGLEARKDRKQITQLISVPFNVPVDPVRTPWCAAFVNAMLKQEGYEYNDSLTARSFLDYGVATKDPRPGDIVVLARGRNRWAGHVGFYIQTLEVDGVKYVEVFGGNQGHQVAVAYYPANRVLGYRHVVSS